MGDDRANGVTVALSRTGSLSGLFGAPGGQTVELIFDVTGYFVPSGGAAPTPAYTWAQVRLVAHD